MQNDLQDKKKQEILQRIQSREKERKEKEEERKAISKQETEDEDPLQFWRNFNELKNRTLICS
jgi:ATP-dependent RNA circularization protein (DNA/RNA ligase family)